MANSRKPTHLRLKRDSVPLAGQLYHTGDVVEIAALGFDRLETLQAILDRVETTHNTYPVLEAGVLRAGAFVPLPKPPAPEEHGLQLPEPADETEPAGEADDDPLEE